MIALIDFASGNLRSAQKALLKVGADVRVVRRPEEINGARAVVLPGVGAFDDCMQALRKQELLDAGADHVVATAEEDLAARVNEITGGHGADVIFDPVAGKFVETLAKCAAMHGRLVEYGALSLEPAPFPFRPALAKLLTMRGYTLHQVSGDPAALDQAVRYITEKIEAGVLRPKIAKVFHGLEQIGAAQDFMESNQQVGKIVVVV